LLIVFVSVRAVMWHNNKYVLPMLVDMKQTADYLI